MTEQIATYLERGAGLISLFAVLIIVVGFVLASGRYAQRFRPSEPSASWPRLQPAIRSSELTSLRQGKTTLLFFRSAALIALSKSTEQREQREHLRKLPIHIGDL